MVDDQNLSKIIISSLFNVDKKKKEKVKIQLKLLNLQDIKLPKKKNVII